MQCQHARCAAPCPAAACPGAAAAPKRRRGRLDESLPCHTQPHTPHPTPLCQVTAGGKTYSAPFAVITLPVGVLKAGSVQFAPPLPAGKRAALSGLAMGTLNKVILSFPAAARWPNVNWIARLPLKSDEGRWREFFSLRKATGRPVMVAFTAGARARGAARASGKQLPCSRGLGHGTGPRV